MQLSIGIGQSTSTAAVFEYFMIFDYSPIFDVL